MPSLEFRTICHLCRWIPGLHCQCQVKADVLTKQMDQSGWIPVNTSHTSAEHLWNIWVGIINMNYLSTKATAISPNPSTTSEVLPSKLPALSLSNHFAVQQGSRACQNFSYRIGSKNPSVSTEFLQVVALSEIGLGHIFGHRRLPLQNGPNVIQHYPEEIEVKTANQKKHPYALMILGPWIACWPLREID